MFSFVKSFLLEIATGLGMFVKRRSCSTSLLGLLEVFFFLEFHWDPLCGVVNHRFALFGDSAK